MIRIADPIPMGDDVLAFTGPALGDRSVLQANERRHFDATVGPWISDEPIACRAGDDNLIR